MIESIVHGDIQELRLNRPPANALTLELITALREGVESAASGGAGAVVLSGMPGIFTAGHDVPLLLTRGRDEVGAFWRAFFDLLRAVALCPVPVFAAITGHSPAGGTVIAIFCDGRIMAEGRYRIGLNEVQVGIALPAFVFAAFRRIVGQRTAERLAVPGLLIEAREALDVGLVDRLVPPDTVVETTLERCRALLRMPRDAMLKTRAVARGDLRELVESVRPDEVDRVVDRWFSDETQAALKALVKRIGKGQA
jgi:3,2-trans-enoyl-CoA isomerase